MWVFVLLGLLVFSISPIAAQKYANNWFFGHGIGLNFQTGIGVFDSTNTLNASEATCSMSDAHGNLIFYYVGDSLMNGQHQKMANGDSVGPSEDHTISQFIAVQQPDSAHRYYLLTPRITLTSGLQLLYSVIDMSKQGGLGEVVEKNTVLIPGNGSELVTAVKHANGRDVWITSMRRDQSVGTVLNDTLYTFLLSATGISGPIKYPTNNRIRYFVTQSRFSPGGAHYATIFENSIFNHGIVLYDFDPATGTMSNEVKVNYPFGEYTRALEFSCDGKKLYSTTSLAFYQYDLSTFDSASVNGSQYLVDTLPALSQDLFMSLQLGPDQRIYMYRWDTTFYGVVHDANVFGIGCNYDTFAVSRPVYYYSNFFPAFEPTCLCQMNVQVGLACLGDSTEFIFSNTLSVDSVKWNFGEPSSGLSNTDTGFIAQHFYSNSGVYDVEVIYYQQGAADTIYKQAKVIAVPQIDLGPDTLICAWDSLLLDVPLAHTTYTWHDGSTDSTYWAHDPDSIWVTLSNYCGKASDTLLLDTVPAFTIDIGMDTTLCAGDSILLNATTVMANYHWQNSATDSVFVVTQQGLYLVTVSNSCYTRIDSIQIDSLPIPLVDLGNDTVMCEGDTIQMAINTILVDFLWQDSSTAQQFQVLEPDTFWLQVNNVCGLHSDTLIIDSLIPALVHLPADSMLCLGDTVLLDATVNLGTYLWQDSSTNAQLEATQTGTYWATATNACGTSSDTVSFEFLDLPMLDLGNDTVVCVGDSFWLHANTYLGTYSWQDNSMDSAFQVTDSGQYSVTVSNGCFSAMDSLLVTYINLPAFDLGPDTFLCEGYSISLEANGQQASFLWHNGATTSNILEQQGGQKWATATNICGSFSDSVFVADVLFPLVQLPGDTAICENDSTVLDASFSGAWHLWQNLSTDSLQVVQQAGQYWVQVENVCGIASDTMDLSVDDSLLFDLGPDMLLCAGDTLQLSTFLSNDYPHFWQDSSTANQVLVLVSGNYWVFVSNACGENSDTVVAVFSSQPQIDLGNDTLLCQGESLALNATFPFANYSWSNGLQTSEIQVLVAGDYHVTVSNHCGTTTDSVQIHFDDSLTVDLGSDRNGCFGVPKTLTATVSGDASYRWSTDDVSETTIVNDAGTYWLEVSNVCGFAADTIEVFLIDLPTVQLPADTQMCANDSIWVAGLSSSGSLLWNNGSTVPSRWIAQAGWHWLTATNYCGEARDSMLVLVEPNPQISLGADQQICPGEQLRLQPYPPNLNYEWQDGSFGNRFDAREAGEYWVVGHTLLACSGSDTVLIQLCPALWVPNAFTPDGDQLNDVFRVKGEQLQDFQLQVFNRWGELLFETRNPEAGWNGMFQGELAPQGVYSWRLFFINADREEEVRAGKVTLIR